MTGLKRYLNWRTRTARAPLTLGERAARYGALAFVIGGAILTVPVLQGAGMAEAMRPAPPPGTPWANLKRFGWEMGQEAPR